jgi:hypothetical protein
MNPEAPGPDSQIGEFVSAERVTPVAEAPAMEVAPAREGSQEKGAHIKETTATSARSRQEYPLDIMVNGQALVAEDAAKEGAMESHTRSHVLALEQLRCEEGERWAHLDAMLGSLGLLHWVSCQVALHCFAFLLYVVAPKCRVGSKAAGSGLLCSD